MKHSKTALIVLLFALASLGAQMPSRQTLHLESDGFPGGHGTPEGAACDLARAFVRHDPALFRRTCLPPYGPAAYSKFLDQVVESMRREAAKEAPSLAGPKAIEKVFAARHLSHDGPSSYGYAVFGFQDVMFVDVGAILQGGERAINRTMVIKYKDGNWYAHPAPDVSPLLSRGLNDESPSERDLSTAYELVK